MHSVFFLLLHGIQHLENEQIHSAPQHQKHRRLRPQGQGKQSQQPTQQHAALPGSKQCNSGPQQQWTPGNAAGKPSHHPEPHQIANYVAGIIGRKNPVKAKDGYTNQQHGDPDHILGKIVDGRKILPSHTTQDPLQHDLQIDKGNHRCQDPQHPSCKGVSSDQGADLTAIQQKQQHHKPGKPQRPPQHTANQRPGILAAAGTPVPGKLRHQDAGQTS